jgi:hypothetical protein
MTKKLLQSPASNLGLFIGLTIGFGQALYLDYKIEKNYNEQLKKIQRLNSKLDQTAERLESIQKHIYVD